MTRFNFETSLSDSCDLINGYAIIGSNYEIVTANEAFFHFIGISPYYTIINIIHQVDLDDFFSVVNSLHVNQQVTMVVRMKSFDNSYRWVSLSLKRFAVTQGMNPTVDYIELLVSDILSLEKIKDTYFPLKLEDAFNISDESSEFHPDFISCARNLPSYAELNQIVKESYLGKNHTYICLFVIEIDNYEVIQNEKGLEFVNELYFVITEVAREMLQDRGMLGSFGERCIYIVLKEMNDELRLRAFIETFRSKVSWKYRQLYDKPITFSIGISRGPFNGNSIDTLWSKALIGLNTAKEKGQNRFIIYRENILGEI